MNNTSVENLQLLMCAGSLAFIGLLLYLASRSASEPAKETIIRTRHSREAVLAQIARTFPRSWISRRFNWECSERSNQITYDGYYLPNSLGCLILLLTGIIPGFIILYLVARKTEHVTFFFNNFDEDGIINVEARGTLSKQIVQQLSLQLASEQ